MRQYIRGALGDPISQFWYFLAIMKRIRNREEI